MKFSAVAQNHLVDSAPPFIRRVLADGNQVFLDSKVRLKDSLPKGGRLIFDIMCLGLFVKPSQKTGRRNNATHDEQVDLKVARDDRFFDAIVGETVSTGVYVASATTGTGWI